jgi:hypothetical protein
VTLAEVLHPALEERVVLDRDEASLVRPVLEDPAAPEQAGDGRLRVGAYPRGQRQPVGTVDRRDRIELHGAEPADRRLDVGGSASPEPRRIALVGNEIPPQLRKGDRLHCPGQRPRTGPYASIGTYPGRAATPREPGAERRIRLEVEAALLGDVRVRVDEMSAIEKRRRRAIAAVEVAVDRRRAPVARAPLRSSSVAVLSRSPSSVIQKRATAMSARARTARRTSTGATRARSSGSAGTYGVPSREVPEDRVRLGEVLAVVELERGHAQRRVLAAEELRRFERSNTSTSIALVRDVEQGEQLAAPSSSSPTSCEL